MIVDEYCAEYKDLFKEVRNYECFKYLHLGIMSPLKLKSNSCLVGKKLALIMQVKLRTADTPITLAMVG